MTESKRPPKDEFHGSGPCIRRYLKEMRARRSGKIPTVLTPWKEINKVIGGLEPGNLYGIVAPTGMGKTTIVEELTINAARSGSLVGLISTEMLWGDMIFRQAIRKLGMPYKNPTVYTNDEFEKIARVMGSMQDLSVQIYDQGRSSLDLVECLVGEAKREYDANLIVVDHIQHLSAPHCRRGTQENTAEVSNVLKDLTLRYRIPIVAISQMSRESAKGKDESRFLYGGKNSGDFENACTALIGMEWENTAKTARPTRGFMKFMVVKNRWGPCAEILMRVDLSASPSFRSMRRDDWSARDQEKGNRHLEKLYSKVIDKLRGGPQPQNNLRRDLSTTLNKLEEMRSAHPEEFKIHKNGSRTVTWSLIEEGIQNDG